MAENEHNDASSALHRALFFVGCAGVSVAGVVGGIARHDTAAALFAGCSFVWCWWCARCEVATLKAHLGTVPPVTSDSADFTKLYDAIVAETRRRARLMYGARGGYGTTGAATRRREG